MPDLAGWRRERLPDWACEIASPSTQRIDRGVKIDIYLREAVAHLWLLDPVARFVEVFRRQDAAWLRVGAWSGEAPARIEPFDAVALDLGAIWGDQA